MKPSVRFWLRDEGIPADTVRPLLFGTPVIGRSHHFREFDSLLDSEKIRPADGRDRSEAWARSMASQLAGDLWLRRTAPDCRDHVRQGLRRVRCGWLAYCAGRVDLARAMYTMAESDCLRTGLTVLGSKAGEAWLAEQARHFAGKAAHGKGPDRTRDAVLRAHKSNPRASNYKLAQLTGIPESTVRRHRPARKTKPGGAS